MNESDAAAAAASTPHTKNNKLTETDESGNKTSWTYGVHDTPTSESRADGSARQTAYDGVGNKISETDLRGNATSYAYDGANRLILRTEPLDKTTSYMLRASLPSYFQSNCYRAKLDRSSRFSHIRFVGFCPPSRACIARPTELPS
ncbi:MAG: RHS repeat domain-containing protein [Pseudomonadota bacterium]